MDHLAEKTIACPYFPLMAVCGENITIQVDPGDEGNSCIEDCQVCCCQIVMSISLNADGEIQVQARHENEA